MRSSDHLGGSKNGEKYTQPLAPSSLLFVTSQSILTKLGTLVNLIQ